MNLGTLLFSCLSTAALATNAALSADAPAGEPEGVVRETLNRLEVGLDARTGSIVSMSYPAVGTLIEVPWRDAGMIDLACPVPDFEPLRMASRFSRGARITKSAGQVAIHWDKLGASRAFVELPGRISATVTLRAAPDGKSVIMSCRIANESDVVVRQILFPDFLGLLPLAGPAKTEFRTGKTVLHPFVRLARPTSDEYYAVNRVFTQFRSDGKDGRADALWIGYGTDQGGFVLFPRRRAWQAGPTVMLHLWERNNKLRVMYDHNVNLAKGQSWQSDEYWLTPFKNSWAEGMKPYRAWLEAGSKPN